MSQPLKQRTDFDTQDEYFDYILANRAGDALNPCFLAEFHAYTSALARAYANARAANGDKFPSLSSISTGAISTMPPDHGIATPTPSSRPNQSTHRPLPGRYAPTDLSDFSHLPENERDVDPNLLNQKAAQLRAPYESFEREQQQRQRQQQLQQQQQQERRPHEFAGLPTASPTRGGVFPRSDPFHVPPRQLFQHPAPTPTTSPATMPARREGFASVNPFCTTPTQPQDAVPSQAPFSATMAGAPVPAATMPGGLPFSPPFMSGALPVPPSTQRSHEQTPAPAPAAANPIQPTDTSSVTLATVRALHAELEGLKGQLAQSQRQTDDLSDKCQRLAANLQLEYLKLGHVDNEDGGNEDDDDEEVPATSSEVNQRRKERRKETRRRGKGGGGKLESAFVQ